MNYQDNIKQVLLSKLGIENMPAEMQNEAITTAVGPILQSVMIDVLEKIPQEKRQDFEKAMDAGDHARMTTLIAESVPDSTVFIGQSVEKAIAEFKSLRKE